MKRIASLLFASLLLVACGPQPCPCKDGRPTLEPEVAPNESAVVAACNQAGARLEVLKCALARPDFGTFCVESIHNDIPIRPSCIAKANNCLEVEQCRAK